MTDTATFTLSGRWPIPSMSSDQNVMIRYPNTADSMQVGVSLGTDVCRREEGCVIISTEGSPRDVLDAVECDYPRPMGIVARPGETPVGDDLIVETAAVSDGMRPLGEVAQRVVDQIRSHPDCHRIRLVFSSVSTLLRGASTNDVYRFLHIFDQEILTSDALGIFLLGQAADEKDVQVLSPLFNRQFEAKVRSSGWTRLTQENPDP